MIGWTGMPPLCRSSSVSPLGWKRLAFRLGANAMPIFSLSSVPPKERFEVWRQGVRSSALDFQMEPWLGNPAPGSVAVQTIGNLEIISLDRSPVARYRRGRPEIARSPLPYYFVHLQIVGRGFMRRREQEFAIARGDVFVLDPLHEIEMGFPGARGLVVKVPKHWLAPRLARTDAVHGAVVRRDEPMARLMMSYFVNGFETASQFTPDAAALFGEHSVDLLAHVFGESQRREPVPSVALRGALFMRACRLIHLQCGDPNLSSHTLAHALGISIRLLQRIFAERDQTPMARVWEERLNCAAKLLADPQAAHRSVTEIAFACGFSDSTHFGRLFAARMGMPPARWRSQIV
jgi:AraC family transcriptional activator of tynA and feaB